MKFTGVSAALISISLVFISGCLQTRGEVNENQQRNVIQQQVSTMQKTNADVGSRFAEVEEEMRALNGRVEVIESKLDQSHSILEGTLKSNKQQGQDVNAKLSLIQEALVKMEKEINYLNSELQNFKASAAANASAMERNSRQVPKEAFELAQEYFTKKDWKQAILQYQKYREEKVKGPHFGEATYKIGVAFQELGMNDESKTFYDEVISKFPKSDDARRAKIRLKSLKK